MLIQERGSKPAKPRAASGLWATAFRARALVVLLLLALVFWLRWSILVSNSGRITAPIHNVRGLRRRGSPTCRVGADRLVAGSCRCCAWCNRPGRAARHGQRGMGMASPVRAADWSESSALVGGGRPDCWPGHRKLQTTPPCCWRSGPSDRRCLGRFGTILAEVVDTRAQPVGEGSVTAATGLSGLLDRNAPWCWGGLFGAAARKGGRGAQNGRLRALRVEPVEARRSIRERPRRSRSPDEVVETRLRERQNPNCPAHGTVPIPQVPLLDDPRRSRR